MLLDFIPPYFAGTLYLLVVWAIFFYFNKFDRREQLLISIAGSFLGPAVQIMHLIDWWSPVYVANTVVKIEDVLFGFAIGGIAAVVYDVIYVRQLRPIKRFHPQINYLFALFVASMFALFGLFYLFKVHSFWTSILAHLVMFIFVAVRRRDLIIPMLVSGLLLTLIAFPAYIIGLAIDPNWVDGQWYLQNLSGMRIIGVPIEEFLWFLSVGIGASALYELAFGLKLINKSATSGKVVARVK